MAFENLTSNQIIDTTVNLLVQEVVAAGLFWKVPETAFSGSTNDTVTIRVPAYANASTRVMRSGTAITPTDLHERGVDVVMDTHLYHATALTSESLTLDIENFGRQILRPQASAVGRGLESMAVTAMTGATYPVSHQIEWDPANPIASVAQARQVLNQSATPHDNRFLAVGAQVETDLLMSPNLLRLDQSGSASALRSATIGTLMGFTVVSVPGLPADAAVAFHRSAFAMVTRAPVIPAGVAFGASASADGFALRWLRDYDNGLISDRSLVDVFAGVATITDNGTIDGEGRFIPAVVPDGGGASNLFVRAVYLSTPESA
jgi:hypothetical protein